jgi:hypothetical protein
MCFIQAWKMGLEAIAKAETLSHHKIGGSEMKMPRSWGKTRSQHTLTEAKARARYSASVDEQDTVSCFFADQVMGL